jgi:hypothetical protein
MADMVRSHQPRDRHPEGAAPIGNQRSPGALAVLLALGAALAGCGHLWPSWPFSGDDDFSVATSARFQAHAAGEPPAATLQALEQAAALLEASFFPGRNVAQVEVLMVDWPQLRRLLGANRTGATLAELPGKGPGGKRGLLVVYGQDATSAGALHRLAHLYLHAVAPRAPLWLHEGLASYVEAGEVRGDDKAPLACLGQLPRPDSAVALGDLFALSFAAFDDNTTRSPIQFTASSVVDYFLMADGGKLRGKFPELIARLGEGLATQAALEKVYPGTTLAALQENVTAHRRASEASPRGRCPIAFPMKSSERMPAPKLTPSPPGATDSLLLRLRMLPRRGGHLDWYPPEMIGLPGGQFAKAARP